MTFFVRNIFLSFLLLALLVGSIAVYFAGRDFYNVMLNRVFKERVALVETLGKASLTVSSTYEIAGLQSALSSATSLDDGTRSFWLVDYATRRIVASSHRGEEGMVISEPLPQVQLNEVRVTVGSSGDRELVHITYLGAGGLLWMILDRNFFVSPAIVFAVSQAVMWALLLALLGLLTFSVARRYFMQPLSLLMQALSRGDATRSESAPRELGKLIESFASVAQKVESTLERDRLVAQMKSDFISTTAHQLRTPLSGINWALGALLSEGDKLTPEHRTLVERALEKDKELIALVGTLLNVASIEEGKFGYHREPVSLKGELQKTLEEEKPGAERLNIKLKLEVSDDAVPEIHADRERIRWVIRNLIENALRYSDAGSEIVVSLKQDPKQLTVSVKDSGIGIPDKDRPFIFQKFFRSEIAQKKQNEGSGLGLFIAKNIVNAHGGRIWFESTPGKGSIFYFTLPLPHAGSVGEPISDQKVS